MKKFTSTTKIPSGSLGLGQTAEASGHYTIATAKSGKWRAWYCSGEPIAVCESRGEVVEAIRSHRHARAIKLWASRPIRHAERRAEKWSFMQKNLVSRQIAYQGKMHSIYSDLCGADRRIAAYERHLSRMDCTPSVNRKAAGIASDLDELRENWKKYSDITRIHSASAIARMEMDAQKWESEIEKAEKIIIEMGY